MCHCAVGSSDTATDSNEVTDEGIKYVSFYPSSSEQTTS